ARYAAKGDVVIDGDEIGSRPPPALPSAQSGSDVVAEALAKDLSFIRARDWVVSEFERRFVEQVLARHQGNVVQAAAASGIARRYFQLIRARSRARNDE